MTNFRRQTHDTYNWVYWHRGRFGCDRCGTRQSQRTASPAAAESDKFSEEHSKCKERA